MSKRVLVTGASGFVGANLVHRLVEDGHETHLLLRPPHQTWRLRDLGGHAGQHHAHIENAAAVKAIIHSVKPEWVFHLAACGENPQQTDMQEMVSTNLMGTVHLLDACLSEGVEAFVQAGTIQESDPTGPYGITKAAASRYCEWVARTKGVQAVVVRMPKLFGPWEDPLRPVPSAVVRALRADSELVTPAGDRSYVENGVESLLAAAGSGVLPEEVPFDTGIQKFTAWLLAHPEILRMYETRLGLKA